MKARHGLIIGKFYPPHDGHQLLVDTAARHCERVSVIVMASKVESLTLEQRVRWMREVHAAQPNVTILGAHDEHRIDYDDPEVWADHVAVMRAALAPLKAPPVDAVFTSESYGTELARRFQARAIAVDPGRVLAPISSAQVRANLVGAWEHLSPPVRRDLALRVVVLGAESTGKTTLARMLVDRLRSRGGAFGRTECTLEYGREVSVHKLLDATVEAEWAGARRPVLEDVSWSTEEFDQIAHEQARREEEAAARGGPVLLCDTDVFATAIWHERYLVSSSPSVDELASRRRPALYLLTHPDDVPFEQDGVRDGEHIRDWMTDRFEERLNEDGRPFVWIRGDRERRVQEGLAAIDALIARNWKLAPPLG